jgi:hypothetical protein
MSTQHCSHDLPDQASSALPPVLPASLVASAAYQPRGSSAVASSPLKPCVLGVSAVGGYILMTEHFLNSFQPALFLPLECGLPGLRSLLQPHKFSSLSRFSLNPRLLLIYSINGLQPNTPYIYQGYPRPSWSPSHSHQVA